MVATINNLLRWIFSWIDKAIALIMDVVYDILMQIASLNIVSTETIKSFSSRIGLILGIFMLFNLAINFLNYIVSPDKFSDKGKGGTKIILNILVSLILLVTYNWIFEAGYRIQNAVIKKQIIPQIIFGTTKDQQEDTKISYYIYSGLLSINPSVDENGYCDDVYYKEITEDCDDFLSKSLKDSYMQFELAVRNRNAVKLLDSDNMTAKANGDYVFDYMYIFSTVVGVVVTLILFNFCIDLAKRSVKLYFFQIIAPLPIVSNMIPGKGEEMFKKWYKACFSTYLDLFIRLIALFFAVFVIGIFYSAIMNSVDANTRTVLGVKVLKVVGIFIILGALMFAKELPQLIQDLTGIKLDGSFTVNPIKKLNQVPLVGTGFGALGGAIAGGRAGSRVGNTLGGALTGAFMGAGSVPLGGSKNGDPILTSTANSVYKKMTGNEFINFSLVKAPLRVGAKARVDEIKAARNVATNQLNSYNSQLNVSESMTSNIANELSKKGININNLTVEKGKLEQMKRRGNTISVDDYNSALREIPNLQEQRSKYEELLHYANQTGDTAQAAELQQKIKEATAKINTAESLRKQFEQNEEMLRGIDGTLDLINKYTSGMDEQNELRSRISMVQKDIDDLNNEKRQRERFYDYDPSPQENIQDLIKETTTDKEYEDRINTNYAKSKNKGR